MPLLSGPDIYSLPPTLVGGRAGSIGAITPIEGRGLARKVASARGLKAHRP